MRKTLFMVLAVTLLAVPAMAELQNVIVGGAIEIRANYYRNGFADTPEILRYAHLVHPLNQMRLLTWNGDTRVYAAASEMRADGCALAY